MGAHALAQLTVFHGLRVNASKCYFTSVCASLTLTYTTVIWAHFPTGRSLPSKVENVQSVRQMSNVLCDFASVVCATPGEFCEDCRLILAQPHNADTQEKAIWQTYRKNYRADQDPRMTLLLPLAVTIYTCMTKLITVGRVTGNVD